MKALHDNSLKWPISNNFHSKEILTSEFQSSQLKGDKAIANFNQVNESIEVIWSQNKAIARAVVAPPAKDEVSTEGLLERPCQVLIKDGIEVVAIAPWRQDKKEDAQWVLLQHALPGRWGAVIWLGVNQTPQTLRPLWGALWDPPISSLCALSGQCHLHKWTEFLSKQDTWQILISSRDLLPGL